MLGAKWLFEQLGGKGNVYYMRGIAGHPADTDRDTGFMKALEENPGIKLLPNNDGVAHRLGSGDRAPSSSTDFINSGGTTTSRASGRRASTSRSSTPSRPPASRSCRSSAPTSRASWSSCSTRPRATTGLKGTAVYNPAAIGGAGVNLALEALNGETVDQDVTARTRRRRARINAILLPKPEAYDNTHRRGQGQAPGAVDVEV